MTNWHDWFIYDESSKSCLRRAKDWESGKNNSVTRAIAGSEAGGLNVHGYWDVRAGGSTKLKCHRIIWEMFNGPIPSGMQVDHIDGDKGDNKLSNLRCVDVVTNTRNKKLRETSTSGVNGVNFKFNGTGCTYWTACWVDLFGVQRSKNFSIKKLGDSVAFDSACKFRDEMILSLNAQDAGYTERHGK